MMRKAIGTLALMSFLTIDVASAQTVTYQNRSSFGRASASVHQRHAAAFKQRAAARARYTRRRPAYAQSARIEAIRQARSSQIRARRTGSQINRVLQERNRTRSRSHLATRRIHSGSVTARAQQQRANVKRAQRYSRPQQRTPRALAW